jgi:3,5-epimerase/4-reductase
MLWLIYGGNGWIGNQIVEILKSMSEEIYVGRSRIEDREQTMVEIEKIGPDRIICTTGRTSGPGYPNIDYLEQPGKLAENLRDNLHGPLNLASICATFGIHLTYLGTGCIYEFDQDHPMEDYEKKGYTENDLPNFTGSQYAAVKGVTDRLIRQFDNVLNARIRMPVSDNKHPRNFVTKITQYKKVISVPNSMTVLPELLPIMIDMARKSVTGTINLTNPGAITHKEILDMYVSYVDPNFEYEIMDLEEFKKYIVGKRSNNYLETTVLQSLYPSVKPINEAVRDTLIKMGQETHR